MKTVHAVLCFLLEILITTFKNTNSIIGLEGTSEG